MAGALWCKAAKPTYFALCKICGFDGIHRSMMQHVDWTSLQVLTGKRTDSSWMTATPKEYPPLNCSLATCHVKSVVQIRHTFSGASPKDHDLVRQFQSLYSGDVDLAAQQMQPDYGRAIRLSDMD